MLTEGSNFWLFKKKLVSQTWIILRFLHQIYKNDFLDEYLRPIKKNIRDAIRKFFIDCYEFAEENSINNDFD